MDGQNTGRGIRRNGAHGAKLPGHLEYKGPFPAGLRLARMVESRRNVAIHRHPLMWIFFIKIATRRKMWYAPAK
jgi:hypothetical protein